jgi:hypothetical protein
MLGNVQMGLNNLKIGAKMHAPEILIVAGTISFIGTVITACKATIKAKEIVDKCKEDLEMIDNTKEAYEEDGNTEEYSEKDAKEDKKIVFVQTGWQMIKIYAIPAVLAACTLGCFYKGHGIMVQRNTALAGALASVTAMFKDYRKEVKEKYGEEADFDIMHKASDVEMCEWDDKGKEKHTKTKVVDTTGNLYSYFIDDHNPIFVDNGGNAEGLYWYRDMIQDYFNDLLKARYVSPKQPGFVCINEMLERWGIIGNTKEGLVCGVTYDPNRTDGGDNYIEFKLTPCKGTNKFGDIVDGFMLEINAEGAIYKK